jgi:hypothetical protein
VEKIPPIEKSKARNEAATPIGQSPRTIPPSPLVIMVDGLFFLPLGMLPNRNPGRCRKGTLSAMG